MATIKISVPTGRKESGAFKDALKVTLAVTAYNTQVEWVKGIEPRTRGGCLWAVASGRVTLENKKGKLSLTNANAIVRYLHELETKAPASWGELSLLEWEATEFASKQETGLLADAELKVTDASLSNQKSPAAIVLFASLYNALSTAKLSDYPALNKFFSDYLLSETAKKGIELASALTAAEKVDASTVAGAPPSVASAIETPASDGQQHLRPGIFAHKLDGKKIMPIAGQRNILITSALPYVNNVPHLGNIIGSVLSADVFSRYCKVRNLNALYICGTDEYGTAIETKAIEDGVSPQEICDKYYAIHSAIYKWFDIGFDHFGRSATPKQTEVTQGIFMALHENGYIEQKTELQLFCPKHERFLADRFVEGTCPKCAYPDARGDQCDKCGNLLDPMELIEPRCKIDGATPEAKNTTHFYLRLDSLQPKVENFVHEYSPKWSSNAQSITHSWLKQGLQSRSITRDLKWGVPVPLKGYEDKVFYVWFDAPIGYISITANYTDPGVEGGLEWKKWWLPTQDTDVKLYQFMGKDNVPFHTVLFPASLLGTGQNWTKLHNISTTGDKFSKSRGIGVFGDQANLTGIPSSVFRYYLLSSRPESADSQFLWREFIAKNNTELLNNLGNLVNRVIKFLHAKYKGVVPDYTKDTADSAGIKVFEKDVNQILASYIEQMDSLRLKAGLRLAMELSARGNLFLQENKLDNNLFNNFPERCAATLGASLNAIYLLSAMLSPFLPATSDAIDEQVNAPRLAVPDTWKVGDVLPGHTIGKAKYLFSKIPEEKEAEWKSKFGGVAN